MKRIILILFFIVIFLPPAFSSTGDIEEEQLMLAFASEVDSVIGFSSEYVGRITKADDISNTTKNFKYDPEEREYNIKDGNIFVYAQIFSTTHSEVRIKLNPLVAADDAEKKLIWKTDNAIPVYDENGIISNEELVSDGTEVTIYKDNGGTLPRVFSVQISPVLTAEEANKAGASTAFNGSITATLLIES